MPTRHGGAQGAKPEGTGQDHRNSTGGERWPPSDADCRGPRRWRDPWPAPSGSPTRFISFAGSMTPNPGTSNTGWMNCGVSGPELKIFFGKVMMDEQPPLISCLCVTRSRVPLLKRAIATFHAQTYVNKEMIIRTIHDAGRGCTIMKSYPLLTCTI